MTTNKLPCILAAFEDVGGGRSLEVYYRSLLTARHVFPVMAYTSAYSYARSPSWVMNKTLCEIRPVDCDPGDSVRYQTHYRTYKDWHRDCAAYVRRLRQTFGRDALWLVDSTFPTLERIMGDRIVQVFHGELFDVGSSYFDPPNDRSFRTYGLILTHGRLMRDRIIKRCGLADDDPRIKMIGRVLNDPLYTRGVNRREILQSAGLDPARKTILYAPSWESKKIFSIDGRDTDARELSRLCGFARSMHANLILRPHTISLNHYHVKGAYLRAAGTYGNVYFDDATHYAPDGPNRSLVASDLLITDLSSIALDFMSMDKPAVFLYPDSPGGLWGTNLPPFEHVSETSYAVRTFPDLYTTVERLLTTKESARERKRRKTVVSYAFSVHNGTAAQRFRTELDAFARRCRSNKKRNFGLFTAVLTRLEDTAGGRTMPYDKMRLSVE